MIFLKGIGLKKFTFNLSNFFKVVAIRPGKPILFAKFKGSEKAFFGLPGNPISSSACFRFFVYPYILNILGVKEEKPFKAKLKNSFFKIFSSSIVFKTSIIGLLAQSSP